MQAFRHFFFLSLLWLVATGLSVPAGAAQEEPQPFVPSSGTLSLPEAIRLALDRNPSLDAVRLEAGAYGSDREAAAASRWPRLLTEAGWHHSDGQVVVFSDKLTAAEFTPADFAIDSLNHPEPLSHESLALVLEAPLYTSGRIRSAIEAADGVSFAAQARLRAATADLVAQVTDAYDGVLLAEAALDVARGALDSASGHEHVAAARFDSGSALKSDALRAQVQRLARERDLERRQADLETARTRLETLLAAAPGETWVLVDARGEDSPPLGELSGWLAASASQPDVEEARSAEVAAEAQRRALSADRGPEIAGTARYEWNANGFDAGDGAYFAGVSVRWAALDPGRGARIEAARTRVAAAQARSRATEDRTRLEIEKAYRDADVAGRNLSTARQAVAAAEEARRIMADRYGGGLLPLTDLLDAESALQQSRLDEIEARFEARASRVRLKRAAGRLEIP